MLHTAEVIGEDAELGLVNFKEQFILFSPMSVTHFSYLAPVEEQERNAWQWMQENKQRYVLVLVCWLPVYETISMLDQATVILIQVLVFPSSQSLLAIIHNVKQNNNSVSLNIAVHICCHSYYGSTSERGYYIIDRRQVTRDGHYYFSEFTNS